MKSVSIVGYGKNRATADFYPTPEYATNELLKKEIFNGNIWECACGDGAISKILELKGYKVYSSDLINRGYGRYPINFLDTGYSNLFFTKNIAQKIDNIITNPPYKLAQEFVEHALECANKKVAMLLKLVFLESISRKELFDRQLLKTVYVFRRRLKIYANGIIGKNSGLIAYAWFVWDKSYYGNPEIKWI